MHSFNRTKKLSAAKRAFSFALMLSLLLCTTPAHGASAGEALPDFGQEEITRGTPDYVKADWIFSKENTIGDLSDGSLIVKDLTGDTSTTGVSNDLVMGFYGDLANPNHEKYMDATGYLAFDEKKMTEDSAGSIKFMGDNYSAYSSTKSGATFQTKHDAPINGNEFMGGWTIEILYMLSEDFNRDDDKMAIFQRMTNRRSNNTQVVSSAFANDPGPFGITVTNCKEVQFNYATAENRTMSNQCWSLSMDNGGKWYSIVITCDNDWVHTYINNGPGFRDRQGAGGANSLNGITADLLDQRYQIGLSYRGTTTHGFTSASRFLSGNIQRIRFSEGVLDEEQWLVPDASRVVGLMGRNDEFTRASDDNYTMMFIPDTQNTILFTPHVAQTASQYLIDNKEMFNLVGISHLGDVTENNTSAEWANAKRAFYPLAENFNYLSMRGNHDGNAASHASHFGPNAASFEGRRYGDIVEGKVFFSPTADTSYMMFRGGSYKYLMISLGNSPTTAELNFMETVLAAYPTLPTIIASHNIFDCSPAAPDRIRINSTGNSIWNRARNYDQVFMLVAGHNHGSGYTQAGDRLYNAAGSETIGMLVDLQFGYNGGNAWYRFVEFDESENTLEFTTFSPYAASLTPEERNKSIFNVNYYEGSGSEGKGLRWTMDFDFEERFGAFYEGEATFIDWDGTEAAYEKDGDGNVIAPAATGKEGYSFAGWMCGGELVSEGSAIAMTKDMTFNALYEPMSIDVTTKPVTYIESDAEFTVSISNAKDVLAVELEFEIDGSMLAGKGVEGLNGFEAMNNVLWVYAGEGVWKGTVTLALPSGSTTGLTSEAPVDIAKFLYTAKGYGNAAMTLTSARFVFLDGTTKYFEPKNENCTAITIIAKSKYDLNRDGAVDALDLGIMLLYVGFDTDSPDWGTLVKVYDAWGNPVTASMCDVNSDGVIDMLDLLDLFIHYTK